MTITKCSSFVKIFCVALFCTLLICGCSSTYTVGARNAGADVEFNELAAEFGKQEVRIILTNEEERNGTDVVCSKDSTSWRLPLTTLMGWAVPRSQVYVVERSSGKSRATIFFTSGEQISAEEVIVTADSVSWMEPIKVSPKISVPTSQIKKIVLINRPRGALDGAEIGLPAGFLLGVLVAGILIGEGQGEANIAIPLLSTIGAGAGMLLVGPIAGFVSGHRYEYEFLQQPEKP